MRRKERSSSKTRGRKDVFHVVMRKRKDGIHAQVKWGNVVIHECHPSMTDRLYALAEKWEKEKQNISSITTLRKIQHEAAQATEK